MSRTRQKKKNCESLKQVCNTNFLANCHRPSNKRRLQESSPPGRYTYVINGSIFVCYDLWALFRRKWPHGETTDDRRPLLDTWRSAKRAVTFVSRKQQCPMLSGSITTVGPTLLGRHVDAYSTWQLILLTFTFLFLFFFKIFVGSTKSIACLVCWVA